MQNNKGFIFTILAVIGAIVVAGWVLKLTLHLIGPLVVLGGIVLLYLLLSKNKGSGV
ncbi:hypothetical protein [Sphingomonas sp.]|uniref:hypothetical protein n=1 Tax=Sphingomonas sp. TaxID=28214 RepID=UPI001B2E4CA7|nr:hypothetical protein [Sphingomonas sp.]MBO9712087.1 hypothetical protein [Sphingomonas sp.]